MWIFSASFDFDRLRLHMADLLWAAEHIGIHSEEKLALALGIDKGQLHRQMSGDGHFSWSRLADKMPSVFWAYLGWRLCVRYGLPPEAQRAAKLAIALVGKKRQARMIAQKAKRVA